MKELAIKFVVAANFCFVASAAIAFGLSGLLFVLGLCLTVDAIIIAVMISNEKLDKDLDRITKSYHSQHGWGE